MLGARTATQNEQDVAVRDLAFADDPSHPPPRRRENELEVGAMQALLPQRPSFVGDLLNATLRADGDEPLLTERRPHRRRVGAGTDSLEQRPVEDDRDARVADGL